MDINVKYEKNSYLVKKQNTKLTFFEIHPMKQRIKKNSDEVFLHTGIFVELPKNIGFFLFDSNRNQIKYIETSGEILFPISTIFLNKNKKNIKTTDNLGYILFSYKEDIPIDFNLTTSSKKFPHFKYL